jgi:hypothetical protein
MLTIPMIFIKELMKLLTASVSHVHAALKISMPFGEVGSVRVGSIGNRKGIRFGGTCIMPRPGGTFAI